jgi:sugar phosphate isomerase/epimerase
MWKLTGFADEATNGIEGQVAVLKQLGWNAIELRAVDSTLAHNLSESDFSRVADYLEEQGIEVACLGSGIANWSIPITQPFEETKDVVHRTIKRMKRLHTTYVRIMSFKVIQDPEGRILEDQMVDERIRRMNWICQSFLDEGLVPVHENCHTYGGLSYEHTLFLLDKVPGLKLVFDTGNPPITADGRKDFPYPFQDSYEFFSHVKDHIVHVHIKDAVMDADGKTEHYRYPGEGAGQIRKIVSELKRDGYDGYFSIEPHMEVVFHNAAAESTEERRIANFIEYGRRFERLLEEV